MDDTVRIMSSGIKEAAKSILHRSCGCSINVAFHSGKMNDVFPFKESRNADAFWIDIAERSHSPLWFIDFPCDILFPEIVFF